MCILGCDCLSCECNMHLHYIYSQLIWKYFYSTTSSKEFGTLHQLRNATNRSNVPSSKVINKFDSCDDFLKLIIESHVLVAAMKMFQMDTLEDVPVSTLIPEGEDTWMLQNDMREGLLSTITTQLVNSYVNMQFNTESPESKDMVYAYCNNLLSLGCFYLEFDDAIKEGDGERVLRCWRYMLPMFVSSGRKNYAIECFHLLMQHDYILSERQAAEMLWSRFINTHGQQGKNIPNDLHCEHLNRVCKDAIRSLHTNKTEKAVRRVSRSLGVMVPILSQFDNENGVAKESGLHKTTSYENDMTIVIKDLQTYDVFSSTYRRKHASFPKPRHPLFKHSKSDLKDWILQHALELYNH